MNQENEELKAFQVDLHDLIDKLYVAIDPILRGTDAMVGMAAICRLLTSIACEHIPDEAKAMAKMLEMERQIARIVCGETRS